LRTWYLQTVKLVTSQLRPQNVKHFEICLHWQWVRFKFKKKKRQAFCDKPYFK